MASEESSTARGGLPTLSPAKRKRLQQCFAQGNQLMAAENYDYANELFTQCVLGDPGNLIYVQTFLANLKQKYGNNRKGSQLGFIKLAGLRRSIAKAIKREDWTAAFRSGLEALSINPWDVGTLKQLAEATEKLGLDDVQLLYLRTALDANPKDPEINRLCAQVLTDKGQYDQAIACWRRIQQVRPNDSEAEREIANLAVKKTIREGGYEEAEAGRKVGPARREADQEEVPPKKKLQQRIARHPDDIPAYLELAELHLRDEEFEQAEQVLARAAKAAPDDENVQARWEDAQIRNLRNKLAAAQRRLEQSGSDEDRQQLDQIRSQLDAKEVEVYERRCQRYPENLTFKYYLAAKYHAVGQYQKAIQHYQQAKHDPQRKGLCALALGQCFQHIKQYRLAMTHYEEAIGEIPERDEENQKKALYLAGKLALGLKDIDTAEKHLTRLAGLDYGYKDVATLLDKITQLREDSSGEPSG